MRAIMQPGTSNAGAAFAGALLFVLGVMPLQAADGDASAAEVSTEVPAHADASAETSPPTAERTAGSAGQTGDANDSAPAGQSATSTGTACADAGTDCAAQNEAVLYVVDAAHRETYDALLSDGQRALLDAHPDSYRLRVFPTRRSFVNPPEFDAATQAHAGRAQLRKGVLERALGGVPFPQPATGDEILWNHRLRYRPSLRERELQQWVMTAGGTVLSSQLLERERFAYATANGRMPSGPLVERMQWLVAPPPLAGTGVLFEDFARPSEFAKQSWQFAVGDRHVRRIPNLGYDTAALGSEDLRGNDEIDSFFGPLDRYVFRLLGKRELLVPANSDTLLQAQRSIGARILGPAHLDPELVRYERRQVWVVEARVAPGVVHRSMRRRFFVDEDGWQIRLVEHYDASDQLWRIQETHTVVDLERAYEMTVTEVVYDLPGSRYLVQALDKETTGTGIDESFTPVSLVVRGRRLASATRS